MGFNKLIFLLEHISNLLYMLLYPRFFDIVRQVTGAYQVTIEVKARRISGC